MSSKSRHQAAGIKKHREFLIQSIRTQLLPVITEQGFRAVPQVQRGPVDRESVLSFPVGQLVRLREAGMDSVEIQLAPHRAAAFRINTGVVPKDGMMTITGHWPAEQVCVGWLNESFEMYAFPRWRIWFSLRFWKFRTPIQSDYDKLALKVAGLVPELELALREGKLGPHMRRVGSPRPAPPVSGIAPRNSGDV